MRPGWFAPLTLLLALVALSARPARAQSSPSPADDLIKEGVEHRRRGEDAAALESFQRALALQPTARALAQVALAEQALGRWAEADEHLRAALADAASPWVAKNRADLQDSLGTIDKHVGQLEILGGTAGAEVRVNGRLAGTLPLGKPIVVAAGTVALDVRLPGYVSVVRTVEVAAQALARETVALVPEAPPPLPPTLVPAAGVAAASSPPGPTDWRRPAGMAAFGVGGVALVTGVVSEIVRSQKFSDFQGRADCGTALPQSGGSGCQSLHDDAVLAQDLVVVSFVVTAVAAGLGSYWFMSSSKAHADVASRRTTISCAPTWGQGGAGARLGCAFTF